MSQTTGRVWSYELEFEYTLEVPTMNTARWTHRNCIIKDKLYTFGGLDNDFKIVKSCEDLDLSKLYSHDYRQNLAKWQEFTIKDYQARNTILCTPIKTSHMLIINQEDDYDADANPLSWIIDTANSTGKVICQEPAGVYLAKLSEYFGGKLIKNGSSFLGLVHQGSDRCTLKSYNISDMKPTIVSEVDFTELPTVSASAYCNDAGAVAPKEESST